jgi:putative restriction endonuclease
VKSKTVQDFLNLSVGDEIEKRNLFGLIQYQKIESSDYWSGHEYVIRNTPQQDINWIGKLPMIKAVIVKTRKGPYADDGWVDTAQLNYH